MLGKLGVLRIQGSDTAHIVLNQVLSMRFVWATSQFFRRAIVFGSLQIVCAYLHLAFGLMVPVTVMLFGTTLALIWRFLDPMSEWERRALSASCAFSMLLFFIEHGFTTALGALWIVMLIACMMTLVVRAIGFSDEHTIH